MGEAGGELGSSSAVLLIMRPCGEAAGKKEKKMTKDIETTDIKGKKK